MLMVSPAQGCGETGSRAAPPLAALAASAYSPGAAFWLFAPLHAISALLIFGVGRESLQGKRPADAPSTQEIDAGAPARPTA